MAALKCFVSRWKVQGKLWTPENTRGPPLRGQRRRSRFSGFTRPSRRRGRPVHGEAQSFRSCTLNTACSRASPTTLTSALAHALKEKGSRERPFAKARNGVGWKPAKAGVLPGKLTEPVSALYALEAEGQRGTKRRFSVAPLLSSLKLRFACKAGPFCRSRQNGGRHGWRLGASLLAVVENADAELLWGAAFFATTHGKMLPSCN